MEKFSYMSSQNIGYVEDLFQVFLSNPQAVDPEWRMFFEGIEFAKKIGGGGSFSAKEIKVYDLIRAYRKYGHNKATLDPLANTPSNYTDLDLKNYGLDDKDLNSSFEVSSFAGMPKAKLKDVIAQMEKVYCGNLAVEFADVSLEVNKWVIKEMEQTNFTLSGDDKKRIYQELVRTEALEKFIHTRYVGAKRFSIEGADAMIPMLEHIVQMGARSYGVQEIVLGMAHRGRVNVLANFMQKPLELIFAEFDGAYNPNQNYAADGDVKYHMGYSIDKEVLGANHVHVSLAFNPSHLEAVDPVVCGMTRAKQRLRKDNKERKKVIPVLIHGDAAFIGQGVVPETLQLSQLEGYCIGGTVHIVSNNQVGFTTSPEYSRSSKYCTDVAKSLNIPIIHVNGDDIEACIHAIDIAFRFRQQFGKDIVIDVVCYRRFGHNEGDEPAFTQPLMYQVIKNHPTLREIYAKKLIAEGIISNTDAENALAKEFDRQQEILERSRKEATTPKFFTLEGVWKGLRRATAQDFLTKVDTTASSQTLYKVGEILTTVPAGFTPHPKMQKQIETRKKMMETGTVDWGMGELLAYGSLVMEKTPVRLSGQDVGRGTFTHRHSIFHDVNTGARYSPLNSIHPEVADFAVHDSMLSEMAVLGFEYGNSITDPRALMIWEAQFGDFANGAQIIIDQFLASAESKWQRMSGLVLLLPHGYEGQGPEHSSARLERFLQMCAQENLQVCNLTTPAQLFHALRRQVKRDFRKPLIIMSPKSLLRHPKVISSLQDFSAGGFQEVLPDAVALKDAAKVKRVVLCTGKLYYDLEDEREKNANDGSTAIIRVEQLYPFPAEQVSTAVRAFPNAKQILWAQEEPKNMGSYSFVAPRLQELFGDLGAKGVGFRYVGRTERASPAIGSPKLHAQEQSEIIKGCFK